MNPLPAPRKRRGGPGGPVRVACEECRRSKKKCSGQFPCEGCVKRGCGAMCPEGVAKVGTGNIYISSSAKVLRAKISQLASRVGELENALGNSHSLSTTGTHPLLSDELLKIKEPLEIKSDQPDPHNMDEESDDDNFVHGLGALSVTESGRRVFFGDPANSWDRLQKDDEWSRKPKENQIESIPFLSNMFLFTAGVNEAANDLRDSIKTFLPAPSMARRIVDVYYANAAWMYTPVMEEDFHEAVFRPIYEPGTRLPDDFIESHTLAVLYLILAIGTLQDLEKPRLSLEATRYYQLGCAALSLHSPYDEGSIPAIQALLLICHYNLYAESEASYYVFLGLAVRLCVSMGLHRDSQEFNLSPEDTKRRRSLMWAVYTCELLKGLHYGRPPALSPRHINTRMAYETTLNAAGQVEMSYWAWYHRFCRLCLSTVHDRVLSLRKPKYRVILELDKRVREFYVPPSLLVPGLDGVPLTAEEEPLNFPRDVQRYNTFSMKFFTLFNMHRGFFAKALEDHPNDPLASEYYPSVLATYNAACSYVNLAEIQYSRYPGHFKRMWCFYGQVFSCSIVLGSIALKKNMPQAPFALSRLDIARRFYEDSAYHPRCAQILPILRKMSDQARSALYPQLPTNPNLYNTWSPTPEPQPLVPVNSVQSVPSDCWPGQGRDSQCVMSLPALPQFDSTTINWPQALDIHYEGLDDIPHFVKTIPDEAMGFADPNASWQSLLDQCMQV